MSILDKKTSLDLVKLVVFMVITAIFTSALVLVIGNITGGSAREFRADFVDATGVVKGDDVRIAGVKVGTVKDVEIVDRTRARVTFSVADEARVTEGTQVAIRYRNLVGQRYLSLSESGESADKQATNKVIPVDRTSPALDLTVLFNGFKPLFQALSPQDLDQLSYEIIQVFQNEGGTVEGLLGHTAEITQTLSERDAVIGDLILNLNEVLVTVGDRDDQLSGLIVNLRDLVSGLVDDKDAILDSLDDISALAVQTADLAKGVRAPLVNDVKALRQVAGNLARNRAEIDRALQVLPIKLTKIGRTATYGSYFNFFLCSFTGQVKVGPLPPLAVTYPPTESLTPKRCFLK
ncbi:MCE family protein [Nocardioides daejeonensis]|uniref:MCE family protein n=1 Tax=Nocardioides daejeonensis TaxID=1046556 RepID=UPI000D74A78D|nr:MlaD family protein [Nocardioides daejeonensis]